jgi:glycosyltransferase involved in cell wall biosynthesis
MIQTPKRINVLQAIRQGKIGGGESHVLDLVGYLDKQRFNPVVLSFTDGPMMEALQQMGVPGHVIHTEKPFDIRVWRQVKDFLRQQEIDIVHVHGTRANTNVLWAARMLKLPVIYTIHGWSFHDELPLLKRMARIAAEKIITTNTRLNITVSDANQHTGRKALGAFRSVVVKNGVNLQKFNAAADYPNIKTAYGIPEHHLVLGYIVRITGQKDPLGMIRAFAAVCAAYPDVTLLMIGEGDLKDAAIRLAKDLEIDSRIVFDNFRTDVPAVLHAVDIYCLPSLWEGFPIGVLEAMAMGKAVIASDVDGTKEAIQHEETGLLVPAKNTPALVQAIARLLDDSQLRLKLQTNARNCIIANFDAKIMTGKIETLYQQLV